MENKEKPESEDTCCSKSEGRCGCGSCGSRRGSCAAGLVIGALVLLLLGGVIGYLMGSSHCGGPRMGAMCPYTMPASPAK
jgi:hypothetical protein